MKGKISEIYSLSNHQRDFMKLMTVIV